LSEKQITILVHLFVGPIRIVQAALLNFVYAAVFLRKK